MHLHYIHVARSCTSPYFDDAEELERADRDEYGKTYKVPAGMTYEQWYNKYVQGCSEKLVQTVNNHV